MCRWAAYLGEPLFMSEIVTSPVNSLIQQAQAARESITETNADGFGLAWYDQRAEPGIYKDVHPAWADANLHSVTDQVSSRLFMAHVRASTGTATSRDNCHPFVSGKMSFMHNGQVGGFETIRKSADMLIPEEIFSRRRGSTDSESLFLVAMGYGLEDNPKAALERTVGQFEAMSKERGSAPHIRMTAAISDGEKLYAVRYASDDQAPSLYYRKSIVGQGWTVVSEPYAECGNWKKIDSGTFLTFSGDDAVAESFEPSA
ncbi:MAG: class II glutamine amidotransferase [Litoreibacter sp.]|uniref:class II glutamine amidotransferase n=1 Tax=Litoreibacter sp. TaxID=1969459 RepID=UPI00329728C0